MPFNSVMMIVSVARISAEVWQQLACLPEHIGSEQLLDLVICFPVQQLGRWALFVWNYLCFSPYPTHYHNASDSDYSSEEDDDDDSYRGVGRGCAGASSSADYRNRSYYCYCSNIQDHQI